MDWILKRMFDTRNIKHIFCNQMIKTRAHLIFLLGEFFVLQKTSKDFNFIFDDFTR